MKKNILTIFILTICSFSFAQTNLIFSTTYKKTFNGNIANESFTFNFNTNSGKLLMTDNDFGSTKEYLIKYKDIMYDKEDYFNIIYESDILQNIKQQRSKSENGIFGVIYDKKNGDILGVKILFFHKENIDLYITEKGKTIFEY
ncbi:MAG: hypothetical protein IPQ04_09650 [Saprospiraceae bacterium]|nr:hypothetical protein [Saprospiraceae bacterium]